MRGKGFTVVVVLLVLTFSWACNPKNHKASQRESSIRFITSERAVFRNCRLSLNERFVACEKHLYKRLFPDDLTPITHAAEKFAVVLVDLKEGKTVRVRHSEGGSDPSVSNNGEVVFKRLGKLVFVNVFNPEPERELNLKGQFQSVMRPVVSPDGKRVVLIGRYIGEDEELPSSLDAFVIDVASRKISSVPRKCHTSPTIVDVGWTDDSHVYLSFRERGQSGLVWNRTLEYGLNDDSCKLLYFGDAAPLNDSTTMKAEKWRFDPHTHLYTAIVEYKNQEYDGAGVLVRDASGAELARFPLAMRNGNLCLDDLVVPLRRGKMLLACYNAESGGFDLAQIDWHEWGKLWSEGAKSARR